MWATFGILAAAQPAQAASVGKRFDGFKPVFNLGQAANGAVCEARRDFDGPVVARGGRVWNITCRGWSNTLGSLYLFPAGKARAAEAAWRQALAERVDCPATVDPRAPRLACKTRAAGLAYVVYRAASGDQVVAAEGRAPIDDVLTKGVSFISGAIPEPGPIDKVATAVAQVSTASVSQLSVVDGAQPPSIEGLRAAAYAKGQEWRFDQAELDFSDLTLAQGADASAAVQAEALYNQALNASNNGRYDKAAIFFDQADKLVAQGDSSLRALGLNYRAADARNQLDYDGAIALADQAIAVRAQSTAGGGERTSTGAIFIPEVGSADGTERISREDRERLRDVQALEIKATALEASGKPDEARAALTTARRILDDRMPESETRLRPVYLGQAAPWLNVRVWADLLRLDRGTPREDDTELQFRTAVTYFGTRHPGSLPLAAFFLEQATAEAGLGRTNKVEEAKAGDDYKAAFAIFIDQRGSLADSADLARPYFDFSAHAHRRRPGDPRRRR